MAGLARGRVQRLVVARTPGSDNELVGDIEIALADLPAEEQPGGENHYFVVTTEHPNYNALYSLVLMAAVNRLPIYIRTIGSLPSPSSAIVEYMYIDWD